MYACHLIIIKLVPRCVRLVSVASPAALGRLSAALGRLSTAPGRFNTAPAGNVESMTQHAFSMHLGNSKNRFESALKTFGGLYLVD